MTDLVMWGQLIFLVLVVIGLAKAVNRKYPPI